MCRTVLIRFNCWTKDSPGTSHEGLEQEDQCEERRKNPAIQRHNCRVVVEYHGLPCHSCGKRLTFENTNVFGKNYPFEGSSNDDGNNDNSSNANTSKDKGESRETVGKKLNLPIQYSDEATTHLNTELFGENYPFEESDNDDENNDNGSNANTSKDKGQGPA